MQLKFPKIFTYKKMPEGYKKYPVKTCIFCFRPTKEGSVFCGYHKMEIDSGISNPNRVKLKIVFFLLFITCGLFFFKPNAFAIDYSDFSIDSVSADRVYNTPNFSCGTAAGSATLFENGSQINSTGFGYCNDTNCLYSGGTNITSFSDCIQEHMVLQCAPLYENVDYYGQNSACVPAPTPTLSPEPPTPTLSPEPPTPTLSPEPPTPTPLPPGTSVTTNWLDFNQICNPEGDSCNGDSGTPDFTSNFHRVFEGLDQSNTGTGQIPDGASITKAEIRFMFSGIGETQVSLMSGSPQLSYPGAHFDYGEYTKVLNYWDYNVDASTYVEMDLSTTNLPYIDLYFLKNSDFVNSIGVWVSYLPYTHLQTQTPVQIRFTYTMTGTNTSTTSGGFIIPPDTCNLTDIGCHIDYYFSPRWISTHPIDVVKNTAMSRVPFSYVSSALNLNLNPISEAQSQEITIPFFSHALAQQNHLPETINFTPPEWLNSLAGTIKFVLALAFEFMFLVYLILKGRDLLGL